MRRLLYWLSMLLLGVAPTISRAADAPGQAAKAVPMVRTFVATGPSSESALGLLRTALNKVTGVEKVDVRAEKDRVIVVIQGDVGTIQSVLSAAAKTAGYMLRPAPTRYYVVRGANEEADRDRLRGLLQKVSGAEQVTVGLASGGTAIRITGVATAPEVIAAGKLAGFEVRSIGSYVVSGSRAASDLERLRSSLNSVQGVEEVQVQGLIGGATLLIYGDVTDARLVANAKTADYDLWPLGNASGPSEFRLNRNPSAADQQKLLEALRGVEGIGQVTLKQSPTAVSVIVEGGRVRPDALIAAGRGIGVELSPVDVLTLPSLTPPRLAETHRRTSMSAS